MAYENGLSLQKILFVVGFIVLLKNCWRGSPDERLKLGEVEDELKHVLKVEARKVRISVDANQMPPPAPLAPPSNGGRPIGRSSNRA